MIRTLGYFFYWGIPEICKYIRAAWVVAKITASVNSKKFDKKPRFKLGTKFTNKQGTTFTYVRKIKNDTT